MSKKRKAVFLDRDGTIIKYVEVLKDPSQIQAFSFSGPAIKRLNDLGYLVIVITNQPIIEKGIITQAQADALNEVMKRELGEFGARVDAIYTCPHRYGTECLCRKPGLGLIRDAQKHFPIDLEQSWLIGDTTRDMETGRRAGVKTILVKTGDGGDDKQFFQTTGDYEASNLYEAVKIIAEAGK